MNSLWPVMSTYNWVNIGSGNGLVPSSEPILTYHYYVRFSDNHLRAISHVIPQTSITKFNLIIMYLKFPSNLPGANELTH